MAASLLEIGRLRRRNAFKDPIHRKKSSRIQTEQSALFQQVPTISNAPFSSGALL
jgi:hypothetical protein